jgi:hypothetical protein
MKNPKPIQIKIPEPCHENWANMSPTEKGRFCGSCSTIVTDYSQMTDAQIIDHLVKASGKQCGHFSASQLQRPIEHFPAANAWKFPDIFRSAAFSVVAALASSVAAANHFNTTPIEIIEKKASTRPAPTPEFRYINGRVLSEGQGLAQAHVYVPSLELDTISDDLGYFTLKLPWETDLSKTVIAVTHHDHFTQNAFATADSLLEINMTKSVCSITDSALNVRGNYQVDGLMVVGYVQPSYAAYKPSPVKQPLRFARHQWWKLKRIFRRDD